MKVFPTVSSISSNSGFAEAGQSLTITGTSLDGSAVTVTVDGLPCTVDSVSDTTVTCTTTKKVIDPAAVAPASYVGAQGLTRYVFGNHGGWHNEWKSKIDTEYMFSKSIYTALDMAYCSSCSTNIFQAFTGFFKAPTSGQYRFLMSCDDTCAFNMSVDDPLNPDATTRLMTLGSWTYYRNTDIADKSETSSLFEVQFSDWVTLTEGEHYYTETTFYAGGGETNLDVGMEIKPDTMPTEHSKMEREIQKFSIGQTDLQSDIMKVTVTGADEGIFKLMMLKPGTTDYF